MGLSSLGSPQGHLTHLGSLDGSRQGIATIKGFLGLFLVCVFLCLLKGEVLVVWEQRRTPISSELLLTVFDFNFFSFLVRKVSPDAEMTYDIEKCLISN